MKENEISGQILKLTNKHLGLLINFNSEYIKDGIRRVVNELVERG